MANAFELNGNFIFRRKETIDTISGTMYPFIIYMSHDLSDAAMRSVLLAASLSEDADGNYGNDDVSRDH